MIIPQFRDGFCDFAMVVAAIGGLVSTPARILRP
jgi:hypothetical protein